MNLRQGEKKEVLMGMGSACLLKEGKKAFLLKALPGLLVTVKDFVNCFKINF